MFGLECSNLELNDEEAVKPDVIKEQVDIEGLPINGERHLAGNESKATAQLEQQIAQMGQQITFNLALPGGLRHCQEIEVVGIFEDLFRRIRVGGRQNRARS